MEPGFWRERWAEGRIGFHQPAPAPLLCKHWPGLALPKGARVFVPLSGKSLDMAWLAAQGYRVLGVELVREAVEQFFDEQGLQPVLHEWTAGTRYAAGDIEILCGDVFAIDDSDLAGCDAFYDRAALVALPAPMRERYARDVLARLPAGCRGQLVTLEYPQAQKDGPPFSVDAAQVHALYDAGWHVELLERRAIPPTHPGHIAGVDPLHTAVWDLRRRGGTRP